MSLHTNKISYTAFMLSNQVSETRKNLENIIRGTFFIHMLKTKHLIMGLERIHKRTAG